MSVIAKTADHPFFDRAVNQDSPHRRIHTTAERAENPARAHLGADFLHRGLAKMFHRPSGLTAADTKNEIVQDLPSTRRVRDLGMKLHAEEAARRIGKGSNG